MENNLLTKDYLLDDLSKSINISQMSRRKFREIAVISGLVFKVTLQNQLKQNSFSQGLNYFMMYSKNTNLTTYYTNKL